MRMTKPTFCAVALSLLGSIGSSHAQSRAEACFFANDFEQQDALAGWDLGPAVERRTPEGEGMGEFVPAWSVGNATEANAEGYFPVADSPMGNHFAMANDAAAPCNCDLSDVTLTTPVLDLSGRTGVALECRVFNEGLFEAGPARIEASISNGEWVEVHTLPVDGAWQPVFVDLSTFDGAADLRLRFRWSDGGAWAGGFAVDDVCLRERNTTDLVVTNAQLGMTTASPYTTGDQRLFYRMLPVSQAAPAVLAATVKNAGTATLTQVRLSGTITLNGTTHGPFDSEFIAELLPGATLEIPIVTNWQPDAAGAATITINGNATGTDDAPEDNTSMGSVQYTGAGWDAGYSAMSCDLDQVTSSVGGTGGFIVFNRFEVAYTGDHAMGISVRYTNQTAVGAVVRAILMDANFNMLDTSSQRMLTQPDIDGIWNGMPVYESLTHGLALAPGDYHIGIQQLTSGSDQPVYVAIGGPSRPARSGIMEGLGFSIEPLYGAPMVRLHLTEVPVGLEPTPGRAEQLLAYPNPATHTLRIRIPHNERIIGWTLTDLAGRMVRQVSQDQKNTSAEPLIDVSDLRSGLYTLEVFSSGGIRTSVVSIQR